MKDNEFYIKEAEELRQSLDDAFDIDRDYLYSTYVKNISKDTKFYDEPLFKAEDLIRRFIHLVYLYDSNLPLCEEVAGLKTGHLNIYEPDRHGYIKDKVRYYIDFFIEYLKGFEKE